MNTSIRIPTPLRSQADGQTSVDVNGSTVGEVLRDLVQRYPELKPNLYDESGDLRSFVNIYLGDEDVRYLNGADTAVDEGDELSIIPSVAGG